MQSTNGQAITLTFDSLDTEITFAYCWEDWVEINDDSSTSTQRYCGPYNATTGYSYADGVDGSYYNGPAPGASIPVTSIPGPFTTTGAIMVKFRSDIYGTTSGFLAVICCSARVTTYLTSGELINTRCPEKSKSI